MRLQNDHLRLSQWSCTAPIAPRSTCTRFVSDLKDERTQTLFSASYLQKAEAVCEVLQAIECGESCEYRVGEEVIEGPVEAR